METINSLDELWPIPETPRHLVYLTEDGFKFSIFDMRPHTYLTSQYAPDDCHFLYLGGEERNNVFGNNIFNRIYGYGGDDFLYGGSGKDIIFGGTGNDRIWGFDGNDTLHGGDGHDIIYGLAGNDFITGGESNDLLLGGGGADTIHGGFGNDLIKGDEGNDILYGSDGIDLITGDSGDDIIFGGAGDDLLLGDTGSNIISSGAGSDWVFLELLDQLNIVTDFSDEDFIVLNVTDGIEATLEGIRSDLHIRWETGQFQDRQTGTNDVNIDDMIIYHSTGEESLTSEYIVMVLEDYTDPLNVGDFALI